MSLTLPVVILVYEGIARCGKSDDRNMVWTRVFLAVVFVGSVLGNFLSTYYATSDGPLPIRVTTSTVPNAEVNKLTEVSVAFYSEVYMQFYFHYSSYLLGMIIALVFARYRIEKKEYAKGGENTRVMRFVAFYKENISLRYPGYTLGLILTGGSIYWLSYFIADPQKQTRLHASVFAALSSPLFLLGYLFFISPTFFGKALFFRATHGCGFWRAFR